MLTHVEVTNSQGEILTLSLSDPSNGFLLKEVEGLDPVKANIVSSSFATVGGAQYQSSRRETRNPVFKIGLNFGRKTVRQLRKELYKILMPQSTVKMRFFDDDLTFVDISGMVETIIAPLFVAEPEATISVLCFDPDFYTPVPVVIEAVTTEGSDEIVIDYDGDIETGIRLRLEVHRDLSDFAMHHRLPDGTVRTLTFISPLIANDSLDISTVSGDKWAQLLRQGVTESVLYGISPYSSWIELFPGRNHIRVFAEGAGLPYTIDFTNKYGGL